VVEDRVAAVCRELDALAKLEAGRRRGGRFEYQEFDFGWWSFALYAAVLILCFIWQGRTDVVSMGQADAVAMVQGGQWWRAVTALTLHADVVHLVSNLIAGMGFTFFVCRFFGAGSGWLLVLLSGIAGNVLNAVVYYPEAHYSIGASTGVFAALGLLTGVGIWAAVSDPVHRLSLPRWLIPLFGGLTLLGLFGVGDGNVDVAAHISGFVCGVAFGAVGVCVQRWFISLQRWAMALGGLSLLLILVSWWLALGG
jgi:membrane associated rhomboid family serine protease